MLHIDQRTNKTPVTERNKVVSLVLGKISGNTTTFTTHKDAEVSAKIMGVGTLILICMTGQSKSDIVTFQNGVMK
jgi:hypothetical protein